MNMIHDLLKEERELQAVKMSGSPASFTLMIAGKEAGLLRFDAAMQAAEFQSSGGALSVRRDHEKSKAVVTDGEREVVSSYEQKIGCRVILTEDSNILLLKSEGFWKDSVALIEYETGCWFLRFFPVMQNRSDIQNAIGKRSIIRVEVSPIFMDARNLLPLLILCLFEIAREESA